ncbi:MAG: hypothetical protein IIX54_01825 [Clostridia bacterium]|nr:hypothetical protein [Clostridia bacterium]
MKKICAVILALVLLIVPLTISVSAAGDLNANEQKIISELKKEVKIGEKTFAVPAQYVNQAENYFKTIDVTEAQAKEILGYIAQGEKLVVAQKITATTDLKVLKDDVKSEILSLGQKAVAVTGGVLTYDGKNVTITDANGKVVFKNAPIIKQTGEQVDFTAIAIITLAAVTLLGASVVIAKKNALFVK